MPTIREALKQFLAETGEANRGSMSSPSRIIDLFGKCLDNYGHEDLNEFERKRFEEDYERGKQFCDIFGPDDIKPYHINGFLSTFVIRKVMGTKGSLKACGPVMRRLAAWLYDQGHWDEKAMQYYRELVGDDAGSELVGCEALTRAVAKLHSDGKGGGGVQVFKWDMDGKKIHVKTITYDGEKSETVPMGG